MGEGEGESATARTISWLAFFSSGWKSGWAILDERLSALTLGLALQVHKAEFSNNISPYTVAAWLDRTAGFQHWHNARELSFLCC